MSAVIKVSKYNNEYVILFNDGTRFIAYEANGLGYPIPGSDIRILQHYGNGVLKIIYNDDSVDIGYVLNQPGEFIFSGIDHSAHWTWPIHYRPDGVTKWNLGDGYGSRISPITGLPEFHYGQDINGPSITGTPIVAPYKGTVMGVGTDPSASYGYNVRIQHTDGSGTLCAHMVASPPVSVGQFVNPGDIIGAVGATGDATGPHLHYNTQTTYDPGVNNNTTDPLTFMSANGAPW